MLTLGNQTHVESENEGFVSNFVRENSCNNIYIGDSLKNAYFRFNM